MDSPQGALAFVEREAALHKLRIQSVGFKLLLAPGPSKEAALVAFGINVDLEDASQLCLMEFQNSSTRRVYKGTARRKLITDLERVQECGELWDSPRLLGTETGQEGLVQYVRLDFVAPERSLKTTKPYCRYRTRPKSFA
jgi:hypothetical protein